MDSDEKVRTSKVQMRRFAAETGTPPYVAPELWRNEPYSHLIDVYSYASKLSLATLLQLFALPPDTCVQLCAGSS